MYDNTTYDLTSQWLAEWKCGIYSQALHDLLCIRTYAIQNPCRKFQNPLSAIAAAAGSMLRIAPLLHAALYYAATAALCWLYQICQFRKFFKTESTIEFFYDYCQHNNTYSTINILSIYLRKESVVLLSKENLFNV